MAKLIYATSKAILEGNYTTLQITSATETGSIFRSIAFTDDGYLITHGKYFRIFPDADNIFTSVTSNGSATLSSGGRSLVTINVGLTGLSATGYLSNTAIANGTTTITHNEVGGTFAGTVGSAANSATVVIPIVTVDNAGHVTAKSTTTANLDYVKVAADITTAADYRVLLGSTGSTVETIQLNKAASLKFNPSTGTLTATHFTGALTNNFKISLNGTTTTFDNSSSPSTVTLYAPTGAGIAGQVLQSTGGAPSWVSLVSVVNSSSTGTDIPSASAVYAAINNGIKANDAMLFKGTIDASTNPNYPGPSIVGDTYRITVAGKIGGASGINVEVGDMIIAIVDNAGGTQATVGASWTIVQGNIDGAVIGPASATDGAIALFNGTSGKLIKDSTIVPTTGGTNLLKIANPATAAFIQISAAGVISTRDFATTKTDLSLDQVENTKLSTWGGTSNITTLGTIGTGTWNATIISLAKGGTGADLSANAQYGIVYKSTASALNILAPSTAGYVLITNSTTAAPSWTSQASLSVGNASIASNLAGGNSTTLLGSIPYQSNTNTTTLLSPNTTTTKKFLTMAGTGTNGAAPAWGTIVTADITDLASASTGITKVGTINTGLWRGTAIEPTYGGTGQTSFAAGGILYASSANVWSVLAKGSDGQVLKLSGGVPTWGTDNNTWRNVSAYRTASSSAEVVLQSISTADLQFGSEFIWTSASLNDDAGELKLAWAEVTSSGVTIAY